MEKWCFRTYFKSDARRLTNNLWEWGQIKGQNSFENWKIEKQFQINGGKEEVIPYEVKSRKEN